MTPVLLRALLSAATRRLAAPPEEGEFLVDAPTLDARWLLAHVTGLEPSALSAQPDRVITADEEFRLGVLVGERRRGVPLAHLLGEWEFWSLDLVVTPDVLVPRPETELLVEWGIELLRDHPAPRIADIGTGSGCIAAALGSELPDAWIEVVDISPAALEVAEMNLRRHVESDRFAIHEGDLYAPFRVSRPFDLVVSNPPYIAVGDPRLEGNVAAHEPALALYDDSPDGLGFYRRLVEGASLVVAPHGGLLLELPEDGADAVRGMVEAAGGTAEVRRDLAGIERALLASGLSAWGVRVDRD